MPDKVIPIPATNATKYFSHREAWGRIDRAIAHGFFLEAVTLEESIMSDRLTSYFKKVGVLDSNENKFVAFGRLIQMLKQHEPGPIRDPLKNPRFENLQESLQKWKDERNHVVHGIVKSAGEVHHDVIDFFCEAERIAREGKLIAESLNNWYRRYKDRAKAMTKKAEKMADAVAAESIQHD